MHREDALCAPRPALLLLLQGAPDVVGELLICQSSTRPVIALVDRIQKHAPETIPTPVRRLDQHQLSLARHEGWLDDQRRFRDLLCERESALKWTNRGVFELGHET